MNARTYVWAALLVAVPVAVLSGGAGARPGSAGSMRPPGVPADDWIPLGSGVGIVIVGEESRAPPELGRRRLPSVRGYLAVRRPDGWRRLRPAESGLVPLAAAAGKAAAPARPEPAPTTDESPW